MRKYHSYTYSLILEFYQRRSVWKMPGVILEITGKYLINNLIITTYLDLDYKSKNHKNNKLGLG